jgi:hypothetical protein
MTDHDSPNPPDRNFWGKIRAITPRQVAAATYMSADFRIALPIALGVGVWSGFVGGVLSEETSVLEAAGGAAVGILAVALAAMAFLLAFMDESYTRLIKDSGGIYGLYRPFRIVSIVSGAAALVCFLGAIDGNSGPKTLRFIFFAAGMGLFSWAVVGAIQLVKILLRHAARREAWFALGKDEDQQRVEPPDFFKQ